MNPFTVTIASEEEVRENALWRRIREWNYRQVGKYSEGQNVWLNAKDADGKLLGGFRGEVHFHWLIVWILYVEEEARGKGVGTRLLMEGEAHGLKCGAKRSRLDTFDWQAPSFYARHGYREVLNMPDYFRGHSVSFMVKDL
jgi:GNAT superfamily N-acetyltransferase